MAKSDVYTDDPYRATASNHINKVAYSEEDRILYIEFYNGACYEYLGVPKGLYLAMMQAPSHGAYFWAHIRQVYDGNLLPKKPTLLRAATVEKSILEQICPEQAKLNKLDEQELALNKQYKHCKVTHEQYQALYNVIQKKKQALITKLTKMGYFEEETELAEPVYQDSPKSSSASFWEGLGELGMLGIWLVKNVFKVVLVMFGIVFGLIAACS